MIKLRYYSFKTLLVISLFFTVPAIVIAAQCPQQAAESLPSGITSKDRLVTETSLPQPGITLALMPKEQQMALGKKVYERSCMHCHGVQPRDLNYHDTDSFVASVLHDTAQMPALGFKITMAETQLSRLHVASCSNNYSVC